MADKCLVSVVLTTYNRPISVLSNSVNSVLNQTYKSLELLIVNDAPDNTKLAVEIAQWVSRLDDDRVRYIKMPENKGACAARNAGAFFARGNYLAFIDDDDWWFSEKLEKQIDKIGHDVGLVTCGYVMIDKNRSEVCPHHWLRDPYEWSLRENVLGPTSVPLIDIRVFNAVGGFDECITFGQEFDLWIRIIGQTKVAFIEDILVEYRISADSTFRNAKQKFYNSTLYLFEKYRNLYKKYPASGSYFLNSAALSSLYRFHDLKMYFALKLRALRTCGLSSYSFIELQRLACVLKRIRSIAN